MDIGVIGLGAMGSAIAQNLLGAGHRVTVWNRTRRPVQDLVGKGAMEAATPAEVFARPIVISVLFDDAAVREVVLDGDALSGATKGSVHVCMSTISTALAGDLVAAHRAKGLRYVAAPMFGRPDAAAAAKLNIVLAGEPDDLREVGPVLAALGRTWPVGDDPKVGHLAKIAGNFMICSAIETMAESAALISGQGGDPAPFLAMLGETLFAAPIYRLYGPAVASQTSPGAPSGLSLPLKDVGLTLREGAALDLPLPLADLLQSRLRAAGDAGMMEEDWSVALARGALMKAAADRKFD